MAGDVGFDPLGLSEIDDLGIDLYWLREAELKHGRVAMLAATGVIWVEAFGPLPGWPEADGRSQMDVFWDAWEEHPNAICAGIVFITAIELISGVAVTPNSSISVSPMERVIASPGYVRSGSRYTRQMSAPAGLPQKPFAAVTRAASAGSSGLWSRESAIASKVGTPPAGARRRATTARESPTFAQ